MPGMHQLIETVVRQLIADVTETHWGVRVQPANVSEKTAQVIHRRRQDLVPPLAAT